MNVSVLGHLTETEFRSIESKGFADSTELCRLMSSFGSDKGHPYHNYTVVYDSLFAKFRNENLALFELGLGTPIYQGAPAFLHSKPGASLRGWRAYFPHARIYAADIDAGILFEEERIQTFWTDQRDPHAIRALWDKLKEIEFDIMIDDGLHEAPANICFFLESFGKLKSGGIYVIEDIPGHDTDLMGSLVRCVSCVSTRVVFEELDLKRGDDRLMIFQKA
jgi:hypothetical protein